MSAARNVAFTAPEEPSFLKKLREQHGVKSREEQKKEDIEAKFRKRERTNDVDDERDPTEEEQPTVVVLRSGDLTKEEALSAAERGAAGVEKIFLKPGSKAADEKSKGAEAGQAGESAQGEQSSSRGDTKGEGDSEHKDKKAKSDGMSFSTKKKSSDAAKQKSEDSRSKALNAKNTKLLSFEDE